jgi:hypothetical protein
MHSDTLKETAGSWQEDELKRHLLVYEDTLYIELETNDQAVPVYYVLVGRGEKEFYNLADAEAYVFDNTKYDIGELEPEQVEADLHARAKELLDEMGFECSLCEVPRDILNDKYLDKVNYLSNQFDEL